MSSKAKKLVNVPVKPAGEASDPAPWRPEMETEAEFNPFASAGVAGDGRTQFGERSPEPAPVAGALEDTAPLQGTRDRSDADSLLDSGTAGARTPPRRRAAQARHRPGRKAARSVSKAKGSAKAKAKAKAKSKSKSKSKGKTKTKAKRRVTKAKAKSRQPAGRAARRLTRRTRASRGARRR